MTHVSSGNIHRGWPALPGLPREPRAARALHGLRGRNGSALGTRANGFTLVEVLATLVLLGIVVPVAMRGVSVGLAAASTARRTAEAASLAQMKLNELLIDGTWQTSGATGDFPDHPDYRWTCDNVSHDYGTNEVALTVTWTQRGQERRWTLSTLVYPDVYAGAGTADTEADPAAGGGE